MKKRDTVKTVTVLLYNNHFIIKSNSTWANGMYIYRNKNKQTHLVLIYFSAEDVRRRSLVLKFPKEKSEQIICTSSCIDMYLSLVRKRKRQGDEPLDYLEVHVKLKCIPLLITFFFLNFFCFSFLLL